MRYLPLLLMTILPACDKNAHGQVRETDIITEAGVSMKDALAEKKLRIGSPVFIRAFKEQRVLELFLKSEISGEFELFREYPIAAASGELGPKFAEGDGQVPEGFYYVGPRAMNPNSNYHLSFNIGYPNKYDRAHDRTGSFIMIHGGSASIGCLAMTDEKIEEIYSLCHAAHEGGQAYFRVHIFPFRMTGERMKEAAGDEHYAFWENLKAGYDYFEEKHLPPNVKVRNKAYVFE
ncbi:murein L,D-transpeptidase family protein [Luteolibacter algae]|uniref:Murein L,D-transpeptidase family protein n=1 Tax=Luteolibacter algae TaxID=454151 RepID=A0ABW5D2U5_9BACT